MNPFIGDNKLNKQKTVLTISALLIFNVETLYASNSSRTNDLWDGFGTTQRPIHLRGASIFRKLFQICTYLYLQYLTQHASILVEERELGEAGKLFVCKFLEVPSTTLFKQIIFEMKKSLNRLVVVQSIKIKTEWKTPKSSRRCTKGESI